MTLRKIGIGSAAKVFGALYAVVGFFTGLMFSVLSLVGSSSFSGSGLFSKSFMSVGVVVFLPIIYGLMGLVSGALVALVYNIVAEKFGGLELEFDD